VEIHQKGRTTTAKLVMIASLPRLLLGSLPVLLALVKTQADKDGNVYSFGSNPNLNNRMYWADSKAVLDDLNRFSALYIKFHNCAWSPNQAFFDDDGENRDGDEHWYQGRTPFYAANAAFSLYGTLKNRPFSFGRCTKANYINSFFTQNGADVLVEALGISSVTSGSAYCQGYNGGGRELSFLRHRQLNEDNNNRAKSYTMGCSEDGKFATALFSDEYCQGHYFLELDTSDNTFKNYQSAMNHVSCNKIWSGSEKTTSNGYSSIAQEVLLQSDVCSTDVDGNQCPNPWGKKRRYSRNFKRAGANGGPVNRNHNSVVGLILTRTAATLAFLVGSFLCIFSYYLNNRERIQADGWIRCMSTDLQAFWHRMSRGRKRKSRKGQSASSRSVGSRRSSSGRRSASASRKSKKKKKKHKDRHSRKEETVYDPGDYSESYSSSYHRSDDLGPGDIGGSRSGGGDDYGGEGGVWVDPPTSEMEMSPGTRRA